jgi:cell division protein ZapE
MSQFSSVKAAYEADAGGARVSKATRRSCAPSRRWSAARASGPPTRTQRSNALKKLINRPDIPRGVYMYGGVGRGKSFLMDCFFNAVPLKRKTRLHFHEFMREVHRELAELQGTQNPLDVLGQRIAKRYRLICFDEFHVADITDAMILHRLLAALFDNGVGFVTTSNFQPDGLYPNGLHRDRILPAIALLKQKLEVINVDNGTDYRRRTLEQCQALPHAPGPRGRRAMNAAFDQLAEAHDEDPVLHIEHREIRRGAGRRRGVVRLQDAVRRPALAERLPGDRHAVPHRAALRRAAHARAHGLEARRFTWLVDVLYDRRVKLILSAAVPPEQLYTEGPAGARVPAHGARGCARCSQDEGQ